MKLLKLNLPNILTLVRLVISPIVVPFLIVSFSSPNNFYYNILIALIFILFSSTDFFDGYFARKYNMQTRFGKSLDPLADKFLVVSALIALLAIYRINYFVVNVLILREIFITGLRQIALENDFNISVAFSGKLKMCLQILMILMIILNPYYKLGLYESNWNIIETCIVFATLASSLFSAYQYYQAFSKHFKFV